MPLFNLTPRNVYHKNGTQWIGKMVCKLIGEKRYEWIRVQKRILNARLYYTKQSILFKFWHQYPNVATWFSLINKSDTTAGFPARRAYERYADYAVFNVNHEGWFQLYFFTAAVIVWLWNWWILAYQYDIRGVNPEDDDLYRRKDAGVTTNFDRTKYNFENYLFGPHHYNMVRNMKVNRDGPDDPRMNWKPQNAQPPYSSDRYIKYYGYSQNMRLY